MRRNSTRPVVRWWIASILLLLGLSIGPMASPPARADHIPTRCASRAACVQQTLQRAIGTRRESTPVVATTLLLVLAVSAPVRRPVATRANFDAATRPSPRPWQTLHLFRRPPPAFLAQI
jgi:hypothetical protein